MAIFERKKTNKFASKRATKSEIGATGTTNFQGIIDTEEYVTDLSGSTLYTTVDKMRWSDASVQAALLMCELPIRSAEWDIEAASSEPQDEEIAKFVKDNLFNGLIIPWEDTIRQILLMLPYGSMAFEVIYKLTDEGKIGWRKWAPRLPKTIQRWNVDKNGELESIEQRTYKNGNYQTIIIPAEKLMVFVHRQEGDNYRGTSILRQAYKHWFFRDKYYKIDAVATERAGIGIPKIKLPDGFTDDDYEDAQKVGENLRGHEKAYVVYKEGWEVEMMDMKSDTNKSAKEMLEHHTREILKSVLAQFIDLGSSSTGSYALAKDQSKLFLSALDAIGKQIEDVVNDEIKKLVDYNWNVDDYPKLTHSDLGIKDVEELSDAMQKLSFAGILTSDPPLEDYMRKVLKLPEKPEELRAEQEEQLKQNPKEEEPEAEDESPKDNKPEVKASEKYLRELTKAERRVKFNEIEAFMDIREQGLVREMTNILLSEKSSLLTKFIKAIEGKDYNGLQQISLSLTGKLSETFKEHMKELFEFGKLKSSYEIGKPAPSTPAEMNDRIKEEAAFYATYNQDKLLEDLKSISAVCIMNDLDAEEVKKKITGKFDSFLHRNVNSSAALVTSGELNNGRKFTFEKYKNDLYGYQWSAILDYRTCNYCQSMDGSVIGVNDKAFSEFRPGEVHFHCRCIWVGITKKEVDPPPFTGVPTGLKPQSQMPAWEFKNIKSPLPGGRQMPYGVSIYNEGKDEKIDDLKTNVKKKKKKTMKETKIDEEMIKTHNKILNTIFTDLESDKYTKEKAIEIYGDDFSKDIKKWKPKK